MYTRPFKIQNPQKNSYCSDKPYISSLSRTVLTFSLLVPALCRYKQRSLIPVLQRRRAGMSVNVNLFSILFRHRESSKGSGQACVTGGDTLYRVYNRPRILKSMCNYIVKTQPIYLVDTLTLNSHDMVG